MVSLAPAPLATRKAESLWDYLIRLGRSQRWLAAELGYGEEYVSRVKHSVLEGDLCPYRFRRACELLLRVKLSRDLWVLEEGVQWGS